MNKKIIDIICRIILLILALVEVYFLITDSKYLAQMTPLLLVSVGVYALVTNYYRSREKK
ncbi:hypothetical protein [Companilactobacillus metriopterae]|uniref:hypothetical protein n=1 Tax=Companilactobacillus metriopterae TaxID=1909267 RepID=UPI00100B1C3F|nr:hypothetical protein [Companilactobacillus metriopterae]